MKKLMLIAILNYRIGKVLKYLLIFFSPLKVSLAINNLPQITAVLQKIAEIIEQFPSNNLFNTKKRPASIEKPFNKLKMEGFFNETFVATEDFFRNEDVAVLPVTFGKLCYSMKTGDSNYPT